MSAYQLHSNEKEMVSGPTSDAGGFGNSLITPQGFGAGAPFPPVRGNPAGGGGQSRGRSLTPNNAGGPLPPMNGSTDSTTVTSSGASNLLQSLFAASNNPPLQPPAQPSPNSRQQSAFPSLGNTGGGMFDSNNSRGSSLQPSSVGGGLYGGSQRVGMPSNNALSAIFPSANAPIANAAGAKDIAPSTNATANHLLASSSATSMMKTQDLLFGGPGANGGGPLGLSENDFPSLSGPAGGPGGGFGGATHTTGAMQPPLPSLSVGGASFTMPPPNASSGSANGPHPFGGGSSGGLSNAAPGANHNSGTAAPVSAVGNAANPMGAPTGAFGSLYGQPPPGAVGAGAGGQFGAAGRYAPGAGLHSDPSSQFGNFAGLMKTNEAQSEFQINNEDFPALPLQGAPNDTRASNLPLLEAKDKLAAGDDSKGGALVPKEQTGVLTAPDGKVSNIPSGMIRDQFGMVGMLTFLRALETDPTIVSFALGTELTHLGLNLNAAGRNLYQTFAGPWMDTPCRPQDLDQYVPQEYITNNTIRGSRERLPPIKLNRYSDDLLFFMFYMCTGEAYQMGAAIELYKRDWRYCKEERFWITRPQGMPAVEKNNDFERGMYYVFDVPQWRKVPREMVLYYAKLEQLDIPAATQQQNAMFQACFGTGPSA